MTDEKNPATVDEEGTYGMAASGAPVVRDEHIKDVLEDARRWLTVCFLPYVQAQIQARHSSPRFARDADRSVLVTGENVLSRLGQLLYDIQMRELSLMWFQQAFHRPDGGIEIPRDSTLLLELKRLVGDV